MHIQKRLQQIFGADATSLRQRDQLFGNCDFAIHAFDFHRTIGSIDVVVQLDAIVLELFDAVDQVVDVDRLDRTVLDRNENVFEYFGKRF